MNFSELASLVALDEYGSIRQVAVKCNLSPAAVHKQLRMLEAELETKIYEKLNGRLELTDAGRALLPFAHEILLSQRSARAALAEWKSGRRGVVKVGAGPTFSTYLLPALIKKYRRRFPGVDVFVETGDSDHLISHLRAGTLDLAFDVAANAWDDPSMMRVAEWGAPLGFVTNKGRLPLHSRLRTLQKEPFILFRKGAFVETAIQDYFHQLDFRPNVVMRSDSAEAIKAMIRAGLGVSVLFLWNVHYDARRSLFSIVRTEAPALELRMALIRVRSSYTSRVVGEFIDLAAHVHWKHLRSIE